MAGLVSSKGGGVNRGPSWASNAHTEQGREMGKAYGFEVSRPHRKWRLNSEQTAVRPQMPLAAPPTQQEKLTPIMLGLNGSGWCWGSMKLMHSDKLPGWCGFSLLLPGPQRSETLQRHAPGEGQLYPSTAHLV